MEKKKKDKTLYESQYEFRRDWLWSDIKEDDDIGYPKVISFFKKRKHNDQPISGKVNVPVGRPETTYDKSYELSLVIRLMKEKMFLKRTTKLSDGRKVRCTPRKEFLNMEKFNVYKWVALQEEVRYASRNGEESILLSNEEIKLIS